MSRFLWIGLGGFIGAVLRYLVSDALGSGNQGIGFPYGTFAANVTGCYLLGTLSKMADELGLFGVRSRLFLFIGLLGAFTTYSAFGKETFELFLAGRPGLALITVGASLCACLAAVWAGRMTVAGIMAFPLFAPTRTPGEVILRRTDGIPLPEESHFLSSRRSVFIVLPAYIAVVFLLIQLYGHA